MIVEIKDGLCGAIPWMYGVAASYAYQLFEPNDKSGEPEKKYTML